jgi:glycosyltransferase involved in cell wall biosynthesis
MRKTAIITRTKNRPLLLARAIHSVLDQTSNDWIQVIVNDAGNSDEVDQVVAPFKDRYQGRLTVIHRTQSTGMEAASNAGIAASESDYVVIHDDDDRWEPEFLAKCTGYLERHKNIESLGGVVTHIRRITERIDEKKITQIKQDVMNRWLRQVTLVDVVGMFCWVPIGFLYKRSALETIGNYREDLPVLGDFEFNIRFIRKWDIGVIQEPLACYHVRDPKHAAGYERNSVTSQEDLFSLHLSRLKNQLMREDLDSGKFGLGCLINISSSIELVQRNTNPIGRAFDKVLASRKISWLLRKLGYLRT